VILVDANLLLYAYHPGAAQHAAARKWLEDALAGPELVRFAWMTIWAFLRIATNPRAFEQPLSFDEATAAAKAWLDQPCAGVAEPGERHWEILVEVGGSGQAVGPLLTDAALAAIAIEHGAVLHTTDRDFARFPGLKWVNPLATA
jgi:toxin-antitoxin system PIN domain toxin